MAVNHEVKRLFHDFDPSLKRGDHATRHSWRKAPKPYKPYVDLDDLLASDDLSFQLNLIHLLTEQFIVRDYARRIGTAFSVAEFDRAHQAGLGAEAALLQDVVGDPTIRFNFEETRPDGTAVFAFRSSEGYRIFYGFRGAGRLEQYGEIVVRTIGDRRLTIEELINELAASASLAHAP